MIKKPEEYGYVVKNNVCLFQSGPFSQWYGGFTDQFGGFRCAFPDLIPYVGAHGSKVWDYLRDKREDTEFNCCEQFMMAMKASLFDDVDSFKAIMAASNPKKQKELGRGVKGYEQEIWDTHKWNIVCEGNNRKFADNPELEEFLLSFNPHTIFAEASPWDSIWGIGMGPENPDALDITKWKGTNLLGEAIRQVRWSYETDPYL